MLDREKLARTIKTAVRITLSTLTTMLYLKRKTLTPSCRYGYHGLPRCAIRDAYGSDAAVDFADESMEVITRLKLQATWLLNVVLTQRFIVGSRYPSNRLFRNCCRPERMFEVDRTQRLDWDTPKFKKTVCVTQTWWRLLHHLEYLWCFSVYWANIPKVKSNLSGEFTVINPYLVRKTVVFGTQ